MIQSAGAGLVDDAHGDENKPSEANMGDRTIFFTWKHSTANPVLWICAESNTGAEIKENVTVTSS